MAASGGSSQGKKTGIGLTKDQMQEALVYMIEVCGGGVGGVASVSGMGDV